MSEIRGTRGSIEGDPEPGFRVVDRRRNSDEAAAGTPEAVDPGRDADGADDPRERIGNAERRAEEAERRALEISAAYRRIEDEREAFRDRLSRDLERRVDIARADLMRKVVEVLDDFDRALAAAREAGDDSPLLQGLLLTREHLLRVLAGEGVEPVDMVGRPFDPTVAEAIATEEVDDTARSGIVVAEETRGYTLRGALLRPARVRVTRARPGTPDPEAEGAIS